MTADGFSPDDKRDPTPDQNDIPDILAKWKSRDATRDAGRHAKAFCVSVEEIRGNKYDLSINRYKEIAYVADTTNAHEPHRGSIHSRPSLAGVVGALFVSNR